MQTKPVSKSRAPKSVFFPKFSHIAAAAPAASHFNARGIVDNPEFVLDRPNGAKGQIDITVRAHSLGDRQWIAEATWVSLCGHLPADGEYPNQWSKCFPYHSKAVEHAVNHALTQIQGQPGPLISTDKWAEKIAKLRAWAAKAIAEARKNDEALPLHGRTVIDLCCGGLGGFGIGLSSEGADVLLACEIDPEARKVYQQNVNPGVMHDDICTLDGTKLSCDMLTVGLLCQAFSVAGKGLGFSDPVLAKVYEHTQRLLSEIDAKVVIIECASQFLTQKGGTDAKAVRDLLMRAGYRVQHRTLNASGFGVAQSRERSFLVATRVNMLVDDILGYIFPVEQKPTATVEDILESNIPHTIPDSDIASECDEPIQRTATLARVGLLKTVKSGEVRNCQGYRLYSPKGLGATLTASGGGRARFTGAYLINGHARGLTPREAARMQGLPEWAVHHPVPKHALKHAGNAVAVPLVIALGRQLGKIFETRG